MKFNITLHAETDGDDPKDLQEIRLILSMYDVMRSIDRTRSLIRDRIKYMEISDEEEAFLEQIRNELYFEWLE